VVNGKVDGPIVGHEVVLKSQAFVTGDIQAQTLLTEPGAHFEGRSSPELLGL
jgi:cytoskeletal protein CcmA (bactofilin family)